MEWTLENGARVIFRHADFEKDQVQFRAYSKGGSSLFDDEYVPTLTMLTNLTGFYGVGDFDAPACRRCYRKKCISSIEPWQTLVKD